MSKMTEDETSKLERALQSAKVVLWIKNNGHPFLGVQPHMVPGDKIIENAMIFMLKNRYISPNVDSWFEQKTSSDTPKLQEVAFSIEREIVEERLSTEEVEKRFLSSMTLVEKCGEGSRLINHIIRAGSTVAKNTRRGIARVIVGNSKTIAETIDQIPRGLVKDYTIVTREYVEDRVLYAIYRGPSEFDAGAFISPGLSGENVDRAGTQQFAFFPEHGTKYGVRIEL